MFREMRRFKQQLSEEESLRILQAGKTGVLGVLGDEGYPYAVPVNYACANGKVYFHSAKAGHKIDAIKACNKVSLCVIEHDETVPEELTTYFRSVILFGTARILQDEGEIVRAMETFGLKFSDDGEKIRGSIERAMRALCCVEITIDHLSGKEAMELVRARNKEEAAQQ